MLILAPISHTEELEQDLSESLRILILRRRYCLAVVSLVLSSLSILLAICLNDIMQNCLKFALGLTASEECEVSAFESGILFLVIMLMLCLLVRMLVSFKQRNMLSEEL